ncbi:MAG: siderophore-interacting protein [Pseudomonadota bacterium]|nr:siderophore-interacting protein [Pseudomonadota bacterium]
MTPSSSPETPTGPAAIVAHVGGPLDAVLPGFRTAVEGMGMKVVDADGGASVTLSRGQILVSADGASTQLQLLPKDRMGAQVLRDLLDTLTSRMGVALTWDDPLPKGRPANLSLARVVSSARISPSFQRIAVTAPDLARFGEGGLHFTLPQGAEGQDWPFTDEGGVTRWPGGAEAWHRPVFTTREITEGPDGPVLTFDVFWHDTGRTPGWVASLVAGDEIALMGPSGSAMPKPSAYLGLIADETAVPVVARILAQADPAVTGQAVLVVPSPEDRQEIAGPSGVQVTWLYRSEGKTPLDGLPLLALPNSDRYVLFAAEKSEAAAAKEALTDRGLVRGEFLAASYWSA